MEAKIDLRLEKRGGKWSLRGEEYQDGEQSGAVDFEETTSANCLAIIAQIITDNDLD